MEKKGKITELKPDRKNMNKHTEYGMSLLEKSVRNNKFGRSILVDKDNNVIAGNGILETAVNIGAENVRIIETTGDELVVVKRTDVTLDSKQGREMALADNATSAADLAWDVENVKAIEEEFEINADDWGVILNEADQFGEDFTLPDGEKSEFGQMAFILSNEQIEMIKQAIQDCQHTEEYKYMETMGNTNSNGNALYLIVSQWADARK